LNDIIHRDLSSNNVLLIAGNRAKVVDFGMSKLSELYPHITPLTQCPGTAVYMPPEALLNPAVYSEKLDIFSTGVIAVRIQAQQQSSMKTSVFKQMLIIIHRAGICIGRLVMFHRSLLRIAMVAQDLFCDAMVSVWFPTNCICKHTI